MRLRPRPVVSSVPFVALSVRVPRARPQTYHFFGDSRRGNILVLALSPRSLLPSLRPFSLPPETNVSELPTQTCFPSSAKLSRVSSLICPLSLVLNRSLISRIIVVYLFNIIRLLRVIFFFFPTAIRSVRILQRPSDRQLTVVYFASQ